MANSKNWVDYKKLKEAVTMEMILIHYDCLASLEVVGATLKGCCPNSRRAQSPAVWPSDHIDEKSAIYPIRIQ